MNISMLFDRRGVKSWICNVDNIKNLTISIQYYKTAMTLGRSQKKKPGKIIFWNKKFRKQYNIW